MFSLSGMSPLFPSLLPRQADPLWHRVDLPRDEDAELTKMEKENEERMKGFTQVKLRTICIRRESTHGALPIFDRV